MRVSAQTDLDRLRAAFAQPRRQAKRYPTELGAAVLAPLANCNDRWRLEKNAHTRLGEMRPFHEQSRPHSDSPFPEKRARYTVV